MRPTGTIVDPLPRYRLVEDSVSGNVRELFLSRMTLRGGARAVPCWGDILICGHPGGSCATDGNHCGSPPRATAWSRMTLRGGAGTFKLF